MSSPANPQSKRVLLDENIDERLRYHLGSHEFEIETVRYAGFQTYKNGKLLRAAEGDFDVLVTLDKNIEYQNNLRGRQISVLVIRSRSTRLADILPYVSDIVMAIRMIKPGQVMYVGHGITFGEPAKGADPR